VTLSEPEQARPAPAAWTWLVAVGIIALGFGVRAYITAEDALAEGEAALAEGRVDEAQDHLQWAMRAQTPGASAPHRAADLLEGVASDALARGDDPTALRALRRLRGGILSTRHLWSPFGDRLDDVNARLAVVTARTQIAEGNARGATLDALTAEHARLLALDPTPSVAASLAVSLGFLGWIGCLFGLVFRGLDADLRWVPRVARLWGAGALLTFAIWLFGLYIA